MAAKISNEYRQTAINHMSLNITDEEMYILLPSENDDQTYYRVDLCEETMQATKCCCRGFCRWQRCKHCTIVNDAFAFYKPAPVEVVEPTPEPVVEAEVEPKITEIEAGQWYIVNSNTQVFKTEEGQWMAVGPTANAIEIVEAHLAVKEAEQIVAQPVAERPTFWCKNKHCRCYLDTREPVDPAAYAAKIKAQVERYEKDMLEASLNSNSGFQLLKVS